MLGKVRAALLGLVIVASTVVGLAPRAGAQAVYQTWHEEHVNVPGYWWTFNWSLDEFSDNTSHIHVDCYSVFDSVPGCLDFWNDMTYGHIEVDVGISGISYFKVRVLAQDAEFFGVVHKWWPGRVIPQPPTYPYPPVFGASDAFIHDDPMGRLTPFGFVNQMYRPFRWADNATAGNQFQDFCEWYPPDVPPPL